jgi:adenylate kinase family enzyme
MIPFSKLTRNAAYLIVVTVLGGGVVCLSQTSQQARPLVILIGPPLSGKTTFVSNVQRDFGVPGISVEDLITEHASELRRLHPEGGSLADMRYDPAMSRFLRARLKSVGLSHGVALDGFPATRSQAEDLAKIISEFNLNAIVLQLEIPDDVVRQRASTGGRLSDQPKIIEQRIKDYHREFDMISVYFPKAKIVKIEGTQSEEAMWKVMQQTLEQWGLRPKAAEVDSLFRTGYSAVLTSFWKVGVPLSRGVFKLTL